MARTTIDENIKNGSTGKALYLDWVYALYNYEKTLEGLWDKTNTRLNMLENLNSHLIPERLPLMLVGTTCSNVNGKESLDVIECEKSPKGLYCQLNARAQVKTEIMQRYVPINYNGIELAFPIENSFLVRVNDKSWGLLQCQYIEFTTTDLDEFGDCKFYPYHNPCTDTILDKRIDPILKHCNFTYKTPHITTMTAEGTLLQGTYSAAKEVEPITMKTLAILKEKPPLFITTNPWLTVSDESKELLIKPEKFYDVRIISTSWLTNDDIAHLEQKTKLFHLLEKTESGTIVDLIMAFILLIMAPSTIYFCKICFESIKWSKACYKEPKARMPMQKLNYKENKRILVK